MYVDFYLRQFLLTGGQDPYPDRYSNDENPDRRDQQKHTANDDNQQRKPVGVVLTEQNMAGKHVTTSVKKGKLKKWYSESKALACLVNTDCFAYVENKLCVLDKKYLERDEKGVYALTAYAKEHKEECFLQFVVDDEGNLHYITLPESLASKSFNYYDELSRLSDEDMLKLHLVSEISTEMLKAIGGLEFGEAFAKLMSNQICHVSTRNLKSQTGLDNTTISNLKQGKNLNKLNVVSACLGIHIPSRVSARMLKLSELPMDSDLPGKTGEENDTYKTILCLYWAKDYSETYDELKEEQLPRL